MSVKATNRNLKQKGKLCAVEIFVIELINKYQTVPVLSLADWLCVCMLWYEMGRFVCRCSLRVRDDIVCRFGCNSFIDSMHEFYRKKNVCSFIVQLIVMLARQKTLNNLCVARVTKLNTKEN